ncbi:MAG TPA: GntR family transcriptional regulator [Myxococcales bacterium]|nr:GntR family transcriptional regulator [Myxococcales bacterium]
MRNAKIEGLPAAPTLIDRAYEAILSAIREGRLAPGVRLNQDELAATLTISRQPVGQALTILKSQGFVRDNGRRGLIVAPLEADFIKSIYQLREAIDPLAARLAAERCGATDSLDGRRLLAEGRKADRGRDMEALIDADMKFHMWIYQAAGNPLLVQTMDLYWNHLRRSMAHILRLPQSRAVVWDEHEAMLRAIIRHDPEAAAARALQHTNGAAARIGK